MVSSLDLLYTVPVDNPLAYRLVLYIDIRCIFNGKSTYLS